MLKNDQRIEILMKERGYIVLAAQEPIQLGTIRSIIDGDEGGKLPQPFAITKQTNRQDALDQQVILHKHGDPDIKAVKFDPYYYRLTTD
jgi:hypothetical protein